ncbi:MAG TPA: protein kinase [Gemmatimonadota bacterium]|nr:protein kinase [Gemmatimonadota bacterium]
MNPDRWGRIEELFGTLIELPEENRQRALAEVEDADLRAEVGALLTTHERLLSGDDGFLEGLDSAHASALLERFPAPGDDPSTIGRYRIVRRLARGGMGVVYEAHDPGLDRPVALKLLPAHANANPASVRRLGDEARTASALDHPNIQTVYEIGETEDGRVFIAMAYYGGSTLRDRITRGPMPVDEAIELASQLARGLSAAHRAGVVHRDIKPENLLVTGDGVLKIVDFGVAKVMEEGVASADLPLGTAAYMSPEQTRGEPLDHRTDLWSAGVVLYEMLAAARPFGGEGQALIHAIRHDPPRPLTGRRDLPSSLVSIVERCLEKDRGRRFESADALAESLQDGSRSRPRRHRARVAVAAGLPLILAAALFLRGEGDVAAPVVEAEAAPAIAVLPFEVRGEDLDIWREGMIDLLSVNLDGATGLRAIDTRTVLAGWRKAEAAGDKRGLDGALDVAHGTGARYAVMGSVVSSGPVIRLGARIYSLEDRRSLGSFVVEGSPDSLFSLVDRLSIEVLAAIWQGQERPGADVDLTRITTASLPALKAYLEGESLLRRSDFSAAVAAYERAIAADSTFAFALHHLGFAYGWVGDERQNQSHQRAWRHADRLPEREALLLRGVLEWSNRVSELPSVIALFEEATQRYPDDVEAWYYLGDAYVHGGEQVLATQDQGERAFRRAVDLDPGFAPAYIHLVTNAFVYRPDSARAARLIETFHRLAFETSSDQENRIGFGLAFGDSIRRRLARAALDTLEPRSRVWISDGYLDHPKFWRWQREVIEQGPLQDTPQERLLAIRRFQNSVAQGLVRAALEELLDPLVSAGMRAGVRYTIQAAGLPMPGVDLDRELALPRGDSLLHDTGQTLVWFYAGAYAADESQWEDHAAAVARLRVFADRLLAEGDSANARFAAGAALALSGRGLWRRGETERALSILIEGQRQATWATSASRETLNGTIRWWIGELLLELDRPREAARFFESFWHDPWAAERLGPIYERLGDHAKAREAYALVATAWRSADPELQPRAQTARAAAQRLTAPVKR